VLEAAHRGKILEYRYRRIRMEVVVVVAVAVERGVLGTFNDDGYQIIYIGYDTID
jgi:hypothetical protein